MVDNRGENENDVGVLYVILNVSRTNGQDDLIKDPFILLRLDRGIFGRKSISKSGKEQNPTFSRELLYRNPLFLCFIQTLVDFQLSSDHSMNANFGRFSLICRMEPVQHCFDLIVVQILKIIVVQILKTEKCSCYIALKHVT